jgi:hypothetical protein
MYSSFWGSLALGGGGERTDAWGGHLSVCPPVFPSSCPFVCLIVDMITHLGVSTVWLLAELPNVSEVQAASIFRVGVCTVDKCSCMVQ